MELIGQAVTHEVFGTGVITGQDRQTMTVRFPAGNKVFLYPDAFSSFLVAQDPELQDRILGRLHDRDEARLAKERAELEQWEKEAALRNRKIPARSQGGFDIAPAELDEALNLWQVTTGTYLSGLSKGEPRIPDRMGPNSLCLMTVRPEGGSEHDRRIVGLFMPPDDFDGAACEDGVIPAHPDYRLKLEPDQQPLFWPYITTVTSKQKWGNTVFKYLPNEVAEQILRDLRNRLTGQAEIQKFYEYFCTCNHLEPAARKS